MRHFLLFLVCAAGLLLAGCSSVTKRLLVGSPQVRAAALGEVLRADDKTRGKVVLRMKKILADKNSRHRSAAANTLENLGQAAAPAVPELIAALTGGDLVSFTAARTLSKLDAAVPALVEALKSKDTKLHQAAARILPAQGALAAPLLAINLSSADPALAEESALILGEAGASAKDAVPALARAAFSGAKDLKMAASNALVKIGPPAGEWLGIALRSPDVQIRYEAAWVLADMFPPSPEAILPLAAALADPDARVNGAAAEALGGYPPETQSRFSEDILSGLFRAAQAPDEDTHIWASITLVRAGAPAGKIVRNALKAADPASRADAVLVVARMFPPPAEAFDAVLAALKDADISVRLGAAEALGNYAMSVPELFSTTAVQELAEALQDKDPGLRAALIFPLSRLVSSGQAMAALLGALNDRDLEVKRSAASAMGAIGPAAKKALPVLREHLKSRDCSLRVLSARAMGFIDPAFKNNVAVSKAAETKCPGVKTMPAIEPLTLEAEVTGATTEQFLLP